VARPRKKGVAEGRTPCFVDEAGFYPLPAVVRTYAPVGQTPVLHEAWTHDHLSAISAVTPAGQLFARVQERSLCGQDVVRFLSQLLGQVAGKLLIVWDGASIHSGQPVKEFLARQPAGRIQLEQLPGYAPELNPDEGVWKHLKRVALANVSTLGLLDLRAELRRALQRLQRRPDLVQGFFHAAGYL
jgi:transposase